MKIELLYPAIANLFGETIEMRYIEKCLPDAQVFKTEVNSTPEFVNSDVDMIYLGPMTERSQEIVIKKLTPFKDRIIELIDKGTVFLVIGNALEIFGEYIENEDGSKIEGLGIFGIHAKRDMLHRFNSLFLGELEDMKIVGFKAQFSQSYGGENEQLFRLVRGGGFNPDAKFEGIRRNNFFGTYLLGPLLILNPDFTKYLLSLLGVENAVIPCENDIRIAYEKRLKEFERPNIEYFG
jgi:CobQ-like glutamine amidotransferase family enzyme